MHTFAKSIFLKLIFKRKLRDFFFVEEGISFAFFYDDYFIFVNVAFANNQYCLAVRVLPNKPRTFFVFFLFFVYGGFVTF